MDRQIKFRAWDKGRMLTVSSINFQTGWIYGHFNGDGYTITNPENLLQYTGLKDCTGKEIYEGDFVNDCGPTWTEPLTLTVLREPGGFMLRDNDGNHCPLNSFDTSQMKVIGNIYKNESVEQITQP